MSDDKLKVLIKKYLDGVATSEEKALVDAWYDSLSENSDEPFPSDTERAQLKEAYWSALKSRIRTGQPGKTISWQTVFSLAAAVAGIAVVALFYFQSEDLDSKLISRNVSENSYDISNKSDVVRKVLLPDSTEVELFPGSSLQLAEMFNREERRVYLSGQASFDVTRNEEKPFFVYANEIVTEVLGTRFIVTAFPKASSITVAVKSGKVSVYTQSSKDSGLPQAEKIILTPNHQAVYERTPHRVSRKLVTEPELIISEEEVKNIRFEGESVYTVFNAIEKMYGVDIEFDEAKFSNCLITTSVSGDDLYGRIAIICKITGSTYKVEDTRIIITGTGCN